MFALKAATVVALASFAAAQDACNANTDPQQIRLAYAGTDGMSVSWNTKQKLTKPTVFFGTDNVDSHSKSASSAISITYATSTTYSNHVTITGLKPDTRYHYKINCDNRAYSFITPRSAGDGEKYKFAMV